MSDKLHDNSRIPNLDLNEQINKHDLTVILEVNRKAIEIETGVADQNEEIISLLTENKEQIEKCKEDTSDISEKIEKLDRELFKIQVLFLTGVLSLVVQILQIVFRK